LCERVTPSSASSNAVAMAFIGPPRSACGPTAHRRGTHRGVSAARSSVSPRMRSLSCAVNVRRRGRSDNSGDAMPRLAPQQPSAFGLRSRRRQPRHQSVSAAWACARYPFRALSLNSPEVDVSASLERRGAGGKLLQWVRYSVSLCRACRDGTRLPGSAVQKAGSPLSSKCTHHP